MTHVILMTRSIVSHVKKIIPTVTVTTMSMTLPIASNVMMTTTGTVTHVMTITIMTTHVVRVAGVTAVAQFVAVVVSMITTANLTLYSRVRISMVYI